MTAAAGDSYRASAHYPFPNPKNDAEREENRKASDEYQRQEEEASDFLDWEKQLDWR